VSKKAISFTLVRGAILLFGLSVLAVGQQASVFSDRWANAPWRPIAQWPMKYRWTTSGGSTFDACQIQLLSNLPSSVTVDILVDFRNSSGGLETRAESKITVATSPDVFGNYVDVAKSNTVSVYDLQHLASNGNGRFPNGCSEVVNVRPGDQRTESDPWASAQWQNVPAVPIQYRWISTGGAGSDSCQVQLRTSDGRGYSGDFVVAFYHSDYDENLALIPTMNVTAAALNLPSLGGCSRVTHVGFASWRQIPGSQLSYRWLPIPGGGFGCLAQIRSTDGAQHSFDVTVRVFSSLLDTMPEHAGIAHVRGAVVGPNGIIVPTGLPPTGFPPGARVFPYLSPCEDVLSMELGIKEDEQMPAVPTDEYSAWFDGGYGFQWRWKLRENGGKPFCELEERDTTVKDGQVHWISDATISFETAGLPSRKITGHHDILMRIGKGQVGEDDIGIEGGGDGFEGCSKVYSLQLLKPPVKD